MEGVIEMKDFLLWLFTAEHIFTLVTVILSGLISWAISAEYFKKSNRDALRANVLYPIKRLLSESRSWKNYNNLVEISKGYSAKYLKPSEQEILDTLLLSYKNVCNYDYDFVCAESLYSYFCYTLKQNGIDPKPVPIYVDDEIVDCEVPDGMMYMNDDLAKIINIHPPEYELEECLTGILTLFDSYCKQYYTDKKISYFSYMHMKYVLKKTRIKNEWNKMFASYKESEDNFMKLKAFTK